MSTATARYKGAHSQEAAAEPRKKHCFILTTTGCYRADRIKPRILISHYGSPLLPTPRPMMMIATACPYNEEGLLPLETREHIVVTCQQPIPGDNKQIVPPQELLATAPIIAEEGTAPEEKRYRHGKEKGLHQTTLTLLYPRTKTEINGSGIQLIKSPGERASLHRYGYSIKK